MILWVVLWSLLLIVPGIIKAISYSQSFFIMAENSNVKVRDAMKISMKMTDVIKPIFCYGIKLPGLVLIGNFNAGHWIIMVNPYMSTAFANLYIKLRESSIQSGTCTEEMFNGTTTLVQ